MEPWLYLLYNECEFLFRKEIEALEEAHVLAEAQRLSQLVEQQANKLELDFQQEELQQLKSEAEHMKIKAEKVSPFWKLNSPLTQVLIQVLVGFHSWGYLWLKGIFPLCHVL